MGMMEVAPWDAALTMACLIAAMSRLRASCSGGGVALTEGSLGVEVVCPAELRTLTRGSQC